MKQIKNYLILKNYFFSTWVLLAAQFAGLPHRQLTGPRYLWNAA